MSLTPVSYPRTYAQRKSYLLSQRKSKATQKMATIARKEAKKVQAQDQEHKYHDFSISQAITRDGIIFSLSSVPQETTAATDSVRVGDQLKPQSLVVRIAGDVNVTSASIVRILIFRWHAQSNLDTLTVDGILDANFTASTFSPLAPYTFDNRNPNNHKIQVLYDHNIDLYGGSEGNFNRTIVIKKGLKKAIQFYAGSTVNQSAGIYMLLITDTILAASPVIRAVTRLHFTE